MRNDSPAKSGGGRGKKGPVAGRIVAAGAHTRERMAFLLGIDEAGPEYAVASAAWLDHAIEIGVSGEGETLVVFRIERRGPESQGLLVTEHLNVYSRGPKMPPKLAEVVHRRARERFGDWDMERFSKLVEEDPEAGKPGLAMPPQPDEEERPSSLLDTWGADDSYADFFAGGEMARSQLDSIDPSKVFHFVQHCDNECLFVNPHSVGSVVSLINFPWDDRVRQPAKPLEQAMGNLADREFIAEGMITTDLDEDDVIRGNPDKLRSLLRYAASRPNSDDKLLFISNTCVPSVIGEDVQSVTEEVQEETGREMLYLTVTPRSMVNVFHQLLVERRKRAEESMGPPAPDSLNLIGFAGDRCRAEMREALEALGLQVGTWLFPELTPQLIESLPAASLNVFYPNKLWQHLYDQLVEGSRVPHISAPAPFGFEATRTWLEQILEAQGKSEALEPFWSAYAAEHEPRWQALRERASEHRLGFVIRDQEAFFLTSPGSTWGVPLLAAIEEMGFGIDVLVRVSSRKQTRRVARKISSLFRDPERHSILAFNDFDLLRRRLAESRSAAFFSYHFFDWRLSEAGKGGFSIQHFEMGVPGAIRTLERLLGVCEAPFYRKYQKYLKRSTEGLRVPISRTEQAR